MGDYSVKGFYRKKIGMGGSIVNPDSILSKEVYCELCNKQAEIVFIKEESFASREYAEAYYWDKVLLKCVHCSTKNEAEMNQRTRREPTRMQTLGYRGSNYGT